MANHLTLEKKTAAISLLVEGSSIRSVSRITGIHGDTIGRLAVRVGNNCAGIMDETMRGLNCRVLQMDEIWGYVGKKQRNTTAEDRQSGLGDVWTFVAIDAESRMVPAYFVGKRDSYHATCFVEDLASRLSGRPQISSDAMAAYREAVERGFGADVDYGQVIKIYSEQQVSEQRAYSPPVCIVAKKLENFKAAVGLHFGYYNFVRVHKSLRMTPAMAGGVTDHIWTVRELIGAA